MITQSPGLYKRSNNGGDESQKLLSLLLHECGFDRMGLVVRIRQGAYGYGPDRNWISRYDHGRVGVLVRQDKLWVDCDLAVYS